LDLTQKQYENLSHSLMSGTPITMRVTSAQIGSGGGDLFLTSRQRNHLDKASQKGKGSNITLSATQLKKIKREHKKGGYLTDMNRSIAGKGMYGVDDPPLMPREAGIGAEAQDGAGMKEVIETAKKGLKVAGKVLKPVAKVGAKELCKAGVKAAAVKSGASLDNPVVKIASSELCNEAVNAVFGHGNDTVGAITNKPPSKRVGRGKKMK
jgi:hypothetical protein